MLSSAVITADDEVVSREVGGEFVLLHLSSGTYFGLNEVGSRVWQELEAGEATLAALCDVVCSEFDAPRDVVESDVGALVDSLVENKLAVVVG